MPTAIMETRLAEALAADRELAGLGCEAEGEIGNGVIVTRRGHLIGIWRWTGVTFDFVPGGYSTPTIRHASVKAALDHTRAFVASLP